MFDPIGEGLPIYTFKNLCEEDTNIELKDGTLKMIVVAKEWAKVKERERRAILKYIYEESITDDYTKELDMEVAEIKYSRVISNESLSYLFKMQDERDEGIKIGIEKGAYAKAIETARNCLNLKMPVETIAQVTGLKKEEIDKVITL